MIYLQNCKNSFNLVAIWTNTTINRGVKPISTYLQTQLNALISYTELTLF